MGAERRGSSLGLGPDETEYGLRLLVDHLVDYALYLLDVDGHVATWNTGAVRLKGFSPAEVLGAPWARLFPEDEVGAGTPARLLTTAAEAGRAEAQGWRIRRDGARFWAHTTITALRDGDGVLKGFGVVTRDETERQARDEALARSKAELERRERRFRKLVENGADLTYLLSSDGTIEYVGDAASRILGFRPEELRGRTASERMHPEDLPAVEQTMQTLRGLPRGRARLEGRVRHGRGGFLWLEGDFVNLLDDPDVGAIVVNAHDITERKRTEEELQALQARLSAIVDSAMDAIIAVDGGHHVVLFNPAAESMFGCSAADALGKPLDVFLPERHRAGHRERIREFGRSGMTQRIKNPFSTVVGLRADGTELPLEASISRGLLPSGPLYTAILRDVSERDRRAAERAALEARFLQAQKMESIGRLASGVAHDFNNLLAVVLTTADLMREGLSPGDPALGDLDEIVGAAHRGATLTRQLLAFSREQVMNPTVHPLGATVSGMASMLRRLIGDDIDLRLRLEDGGGLIYADAAQVEIALMNLAVNARDAMPDGGILRIETACVQVEPPGLDGHPDAVPPGSYLVARVADAGTGMDAPTLARIFEPFFTTKERGKGTGLGLCTVYGIVEQSGGCVRVESAPGGGTCFELYLPRTTRKPTESHAPVVPAGASVGGTVLLVEDQPEVRNATARILRSEGYEVLVAAGGAEALALWAERAPRVDLLLTDVSMPGMSGTELADRFRASHPTLRVLYFSGHVSAGRRIDTADPRTAFVAKPFTRAELAARVRALLAAP